LELIYQPMIKKAKPFLSVLQQIRDMTGGGVAAPPGFAPEYAPECRVRFNKMNWGILPGT
jgi:hypothetical protein